MGSSCRSIHIHLHGSSDIFYSARACVLYNFWIQNPKRKGKRKLCTVDDRARVVIVVVVAVRAFGIVSILYIPEKQKQFFFKKKTSYRSRGRIQYSYRNSRTFRAIRKRPRRARHHGRVPCTEQSGRNRAQRRRQAPALRIQVALATRIQRASNPIIMQRARARRPANEPRS